MSSAYCAGASRHGGRFAQAWCAARRWATQFNGGGVVWDLSEAAGSLAAEHLSLVSIAVVKKWMPDAYYWSPEVFVYPR
jgi:hypothetical protein